MNIKIKEYLEKNKMKNKSVEEIEKEFRTDRFLIFFYLLGWIGFSFIGIIVAYIKSPIIAFIGTGIFFGFYTIVLMIVYFYKRQYVFLRKLNNMMEEEI
jgi:hypothetical protein